MSRGSRRLRRLGGLRLRSADRMKPGGFAQCRGSGWKCGVDRSVFGDLAILEHPERQRAGIFADGEEPILIQFVNSRSGRSRLPGRCGRGARWRRCCGWGDRDREIVLAAATSGESGGVRRSGMARSRHAVSGGPGRHVPGILGALAGMRASWADMPLSAAARQKEISVSGTKSSGIRSFSMMARRLFRGVRRWRKVLWRSGRGSNPRPRRDRPVF